MNAPDPIPGASPAPVAAPAAPAPPPAEARLERLRVRELLTHAMMRGSIQPTAVGMPVAVLIAVLHWPSADRQVLLGWLAAKLALPAVRLVHMLTASDEHGLRAPAERTRWLFVGMLLPDCVLWGLVAVLFAPLLSGDGMMMLCVLVGVSAIVVLSKGGNALVGTMFVTGLLSPAVVAHLMLGTRTAIFAGCALVLYAAVLVSIAQRIERRYVEQARLRRDHERIAEERRRALLLAEHSSAAKTRFLAAVSHEMRTPLNGVLGMAELLQRSPLRPEQKEQLRVIRRSALHLQTVIADLLDLSRIEFGKLVLEEAPFDLDETVRDVTELLRPVALEKGLALSVTFAPTPYRRLVGDASRIKQVLHNLVGNAIKFTEEGKIAVVVEAEPEGDGHVQLMLTVRDTGIGIRPAEAEFLFDAFAQGTASDRRSGTGLGLTISRQLARAMAGDVTYQAREKRGSKFVFRARLRPLAPELPPDRSAEAAAGEPVTTTPDGEFDATVAGPAESALLGRVLVADDNAVNALVASSMLQRFGLAVDVAEDGEQALAMMEAQPYDAVLMDCQMPGLDGYEATRRWRERERAGGLPRLPIVALTANAVIGDRERCLEAGMDDYLTKPFEMNQLRGLVKSWLAR